MVLAMSIGGARAHRDRVLLVRVTRWDVTNHHMGVFVATDVALGVAVDLGVAIEAPPALSGGVRGQRSQPHRHQSRRDDHPETSERPCLIIRTSRS
jgi:hypothetical protein